MTIAKPDGQVVPAAAEVELVAEDPDVRLSHVAESVQAAENAEPPWAKRAGARRDERAQRRQERQENAQSRRTAAGIGPEPAAVAATRAAPAAPTTSVREERLPTAVYEGVPGADATREERQPMQRGTVKWFSEAKGYGFIAADDGADAFVHRSGISGEGFRTLSAGQAVCYDEVEGGKGLMAVNVVPTVL